MKLYGPAETVANQIIDAFRRPNELPAALAPAFIRRTDDIPCRSWSWSNQLVVALNGHSDARGWQQWLLVGRHVRRGQKAFRIIVPITRQKETIDLDTGETTTRNVLHGFTSAPVFGLAQTEGDPVPVDAEIEQWIDALPVIDVARSWGLSVEAYSGEGNGALGRYSPGNGIALGTRNLSTWAHELLHAADDRLGNLTERGQHWRSETVAELGGAILLRLLGHSDEADLGGCWDYVSAYSRDAGIEPIIACQRVLTRTCNAVSLLLDTAQQLQPAFG